MSRDLSRLLSPKSVAVIGGGAWCDAVIQQLQKSGFTGQIWPVHPKGGTREGLPCFTDLLALPSAPDAAFVGINRNATLDTIKALSAQNAGGAVCFASGFAEVDDGGDLNAELLQNAGDMPILGPNCYGLINALDGAMLWPDQHGCTPVKSGVAIITQSSNIAINLTMQSRGLPIAFAITCGNQAQTTQADIARGLLQDGRVTAIGLHIEGFKDLRAWEALGREAAQKNIPLVAIKTGRSEEAQAAAVSHTASLAGQDAGARALLARLGIAQVNDLSVFLETLKLLHMEGALATKNIASISCSGGEAALVADLGKDLGLSFPPLTNSQHQGLSDALGPKVALANPLDYHTYIWRDTDAMKTAFSAMLEPHLSMTLLIVDFPRGDICDPSDWDCAVNAAIGAKAQTGQPLAMVASLPELMPEDISKQLMAGGVVPFSGLSEALGAIAAASTEPHSDLNLDLLLPSEVEAPELIDEARAKAALAKHGLSVPRSMTITGAVLPDVLPWTAALKGLGFAHKTEANAVRLNLKTTDDLRQAMAEIPVQNFLLEEMIDDGVAELLVGITLDPAHGYMLTLGAGGTLTELLDDTQTLLVPASRDAVYKSLTKLKCTKLLDGYRGKPAADIGSVLDAVEAIQSYVLANAANVTEIEINPLICTPTRAIAADALIRRRP